MKSVNGDSAPLNTIHFQVWQWLAKKIAFVQRLIICLNDTRVENVVGTVKCQQMQKALFNLIKMSLIIIFTSQEKVHGKIRVMKEMVTVISWDGGRILFISGRI